MTTVTYRLSEAEIRAAHRTRELLYELSEIEVMVADGDPLRRALQVASRALALGLSASPILRVDVPRTVLEMQLPHGDDALTRVDERAEHTEKTLQTLYERALEMPVGGAARRKVLIDALVRAAAHMAAVLRGDTKQGVFLPLDATPASLRQELDKICETTDLNEFDGIPALPGFLASFAGGVVREFQLRYGVELHFYAVMNALVGLIQSDERLRRAKRASLSGRPAEGGVPHLDAVLELVIIAGLYDHAPLNDKEARAKAVDTIGKDLLEAKRRIGKLNFPNASDQGDELHQAHEDSTPSSCVDGGRPGSPA